MLPRANANNANANADGAQTVDNPRSSRFKPTRRSVGVPASREWDVPAVITSLSSLDTAHLHQFYEYQFGVITITTNMPGDRARPPEVILRRVHGMHTLDVSLEASSVGVSVRLRSGFDGESSRYHDAFNRALYKKLIGLENDLAGTAGVDVVLSVVARVCLHTQWCRGILSRPADAGMCSCVSHMTRSLGASQREIVVSVALAPMHVGTRSRVNMRGAVPRGRTRSISATNVAPCHSRHSHPPLSPQQSTPMSCRRC